MIAAFEKVAEDSDLKVSPLTSGAKILSDAHTVDRTDPRSDVTWVNVIEVSDVAFNSRQFADANDGCTQMAAAPLT